MQRTCIHRCKQAIRKPKKKRKQK